VLPGLALGGYEGGADAVHVGQNGIQPICLHVRIGFEAEQGLLLPLKFLQ
jgi:hypothetical protein